MPAALASLTKWWEDDTASCIFASSSELLLARAQWHRYAALARKSASGLRRCLASPESQQVMLALVPRVGAPWASGFPKLSQRGRPEARQRPQDELPFVPRWRWRSPAHHSQEPPITIGLSSLSEVISGALESRTTTSAIGEEQGTGNDIKLQYDPTHDPEQMRRNSIYSHVRTTKHCKLHFCTREGPQC